MIKHIDEIAKKISLTESSDSLRWLEWGVSRMFFSQYFAEAWRYKRLPQTKVDILNLLMDIGYTFLFNFVHANCNLYW
jgi:hypothetical protein